MNHRIAIAAAMSLASLGAQAGISVSAGSLGPSFVDLTQLGLVSGGAVYTSSGSQPLSGPPYIAAIPFNSVGPINTDFSKGWIAAGPVDSTQPSPATLNVSMLGSGINKVSFLWGSADNYNSFSVTTSEGTFALPADGAGSVASFSGAPIGGDQNTATYVTFSTTIAGESINSIAFSSTQNNAIEISNVTVVPEPEAYGLALAGIGVVGFALRRRRAG
jgi:hypothetical protein